MYRNKYKHQIVCLIAYDNYEFIKYQRVLFDSGLTWRSGDTVTLFRSTQSGCFHIDLLDMDFGMGDMSEMNGYLDQHAYSTPTIFNVDNIDKLLQIIKDGKILPSYKPRTIKK